VITFLLSYKHIRTRLRIEEDDVSIAQPIEKGKDNRIGSQREQRNRIIRLSLLSSGILFCYTRLDIDEKE